MTVRKPLVIQNGVVGLIPDADTLNAGAAISVGGDTTTGRMLVNDGGKFVPFAGPTIGSTGQITAAGQIETYAGWEGQAASTGFVGTGCSFGKAFPSAPSSFTFTLLASSNVASGPFSFQVTEYGAGVYVGVTTASALAYFYTRVQVS